MSGPNGGRTREELAREANRVRSRLLHTVEVLDDRRHQLVNARLQLKQHVKQAVALGAAALAATVGLSVLAARRVASSASRRRRERWRLVKGLWRHPERGLKGVRRRSLAYDVVRAVLLSGLSALVAVAARRAATALLAPAASNSPPEVPAR
jgi:hypothetical protein